jgi:Flp pilus assembly protein TadD
MDVNELCSKAEADLKAGAYKKAVVMLRKEAVSDGADPRVRSLYGVALARADISIYGFYRGLKWCNEAVKGRGDDPELLVNLSKVYLYHGIREKAVSCLEQAMRQAPDDPSVLETRDLLGFRQRPKIPFLRRENRLNIVLGYLAVTIKRGFSRLLRR